MGILLYLVLSVVMLIGMLPLFGWLLPLLEAMFGPATNGARSEGKTLRVCILLAVTVASMSFTYIGWAQLCWLLFRSNSVLFPVWGWVIATHPHWRTPWNSDTWPLKFASNLAYLGFWLGPRCGVSASLVWLVAMMISTLPVLMKAFREELCEKLVV